MTKDQLKLLKKIKPGIKPSELKKNQVLIDEGYESEKETIRPKSPVKNQGKDKIKDLKKEVEHWSQTAQTHLTNLQRTMAELDQAQEEIKELKKIQPETVSQAAEQVLIEANQKIRELQAKNKSLNQTITELKTPSKNQAKEQLFTCFHCQQEWNQEFIRLIDKQGNKTCSECVENMLELTKQATGQEIVIEKQVKSQPKPCQFCSKSYPQSHLKPRHIKNLPNKDPREITLICQECLTYRAIKADLICPRISSGRDTYEGNEFDCYCPRNERRTY